jgi:hypothetical protein
MMRTVLALIAGLLASVPVLAEPGGPFVASFNSVLLPAPYAEVETPTSVTPGSELRLEVKGDEPLSAATLTVSGPTTLTTSGVIVGDTAAFSLPIAQQLPSGTYAVSVTLSDAGGATRTSSVALPSPGFVVASFVDSPCLIPDNTGAGLCSDADGDGRPGRSAACPTKTGDCDDTNPTIGTGFLEVPGDGADNDCFGDGDAAVTEEIGYFVAPRPVGGGIGPNGEILPVRSAAWYDWSSSCNMFQDDDGSLYFWDSTGSRNGNACGAYSGDVVNPDRNVTSMGSCWVPIWAKSPTGTNILTPVTALAPGQAQSEVAFSSTNCSGNNTLSCTVSWKPNNAIVTANLGSSGSGWYVGASSVSVRKPAWGAECPKNSAPSNFTWSPPGIGTEDPSCTQCNGARTVWTMNRSPTVLDERWQYVDNPHAHPTVMMIHEGNFKSRTDIAAANQPDQQSTIASEHWPMYTLAILNGNMHVTNNTELAIGVGTRLNGFPSTIVDGNFQIPSNGSLSLAGINLVRGNIVGPIPPTVFGRFVVGGDNIQDGTRAHPFRTLRQGIEAARPTFAYVFVAIGDYDDDGAPLDVDVPVIGGFIDAGWVRAPFNYSRVTFTNPTTISGFLTMGLDITTAGGMAVDFSTLLDCIIDGPAGDQVFIDGNSRFFRTASALPVNVRGTLFATRSEFVDMIMAPTAVGLHRSIIRGNVLAAGSFKATRSYIVGPIDTVDGRLHITNSTLRPTTGTAALSITGAGVAILMNSIVEGTAVGVNASSRTVKRIQANNFDVGCPVMVAGTCLATTCTSDGNICATPSFLSVDDFHVAAGTAGQNKAIFHRDFISSTAAIDLDGQCVSGFLDMGADEVR